MKNPFAAVTSEQARAWLRRAARLVLELTDASEIGARAQPTETTDTARSPIEDAAAIASAVAKGAAVAERIGAGLRARASAPTPRAPRGWGKVALGVGAGLAVGGAVAWLASPEGREKVRALWHRARGWRKPKEPAEAPRAVGQA